MAFRGHIPRESLIILKHQFRIGFILVKSTAGGEKVALIIKRCQVKPAASDASTVVFVPGSNVYSRCNNRHSRILHSHMFCDTGRCRASIFAGPAGMQGRKESRSPTRTADGSWRVRPRNLSG
ncbi:Uncharacterised protein [Shigella sonnei]|nr:Uncharacterised protein [Shigella sonnei]